MEIKNLDQTRVALISLVGGSALIGLYLWYKRSDRNLPPGPWKPLGFLFGSTAAEAKANLLGLRKYGDICCFRVCGTPSVYLNTHERIRELYVQHGDAVSARLNFKGIKHRLTAGRGIVLNDGQSWQDHRRFALSTLRDFGFGRGGTEQIIQNELQFMIESYEAKNGEAFDPRVSLNMATCNVICTLSFNERCGNDPFFTTLLDLLNGSIRIEARAHEFLLITVFKFVSWLPASVWNKSMRNMDKLAKFIDEKCDAHRLKFDGTVNDLTDAYLKEMKDIEESGAKSTTFNDDDLFRLVFDLFIAGMETTATTLRWAMMFMIQYPEVQKRVQKELDERLQGRTACSADRRELLYTEAVLMEIQRMATLTPVGGLPHRCTAEVRVDQFVIPKDSLVFANLFAVHRNEQVWPDPFNFNPSNFFDESTGTLRNAEHLIPFGIGKRSCLGESLAKQELFMFFTGLLQKFDLLAGQEKMPTEDDCLFGRLRIPADFKIVARKRAN